MRPPTRRGRARPSASRHRAALASAPVAVAAVVGVAVALGALGVAVVGVALPPAAHGDAALAAVPGTLRPAFRELWQRPDLARPITGPLRVVRGFEAPAGPYAAGHRGVDLAVAPGTPVRATAAGTVAWAGTIAGRGVVSVDHGAVRTTYEPVLPSVPVGAAVVPGATVGVVAGAGWHCGQPCLHWGTFREGSPKAYADPLLLLAGPARLLPARPVRPSGGPAGTPVAGAPR